MLPHPDESSYKIKQVPNYDISARLFEKFELYKMNSQAVKARIETPVLYLNNQVQRKGCGPTCMFDFKSYKSAQGEFKCPDGKSINSYSEIEPNIFYQYLQSKVHQATQNVHIIGGNVFHVCVRKQDRYVQGIFNNPDLGVPSLVKTLVANVNKNHQFRNLFDKQNKVFFAVCLQDAVKLVQLFTTVFHAGVIYSKHRGKQLHENCRHAECYDITTLFDLYKQAALSKQRVIRCSVINCKSQFIFESLDQFKQQIVLDHELLNYINYGFPQSIKFYYDQNQNKLVDEFTYFQKDNLIEAYLQKIINDPEQSMKLQKFMVTKEVEQIFSTNAIKIKKLNGSTTLSQYDFNSIQIDIFMAIQLIFNTEAISEKIQERKFQTFTICMQDPMTKQPILYPARCTQCVNNNKEQYWDLRSLLAYFLTEKGYYSALKNYTYKIICPICNQSSKKSALHNMQAKAFIYLDNSMMSKLLMDQSYTQLKDNMFSYNGKKLMLEVFTLKQNREVDSITNPDIQQKGQIQFSNIMCQLSKRKLQDPLLLLKCDQQNHISFESFYELYNNSSQTMSLCKCASCNLRTIKKDSFFDEIIYDGILVEALNLANPNIDISKPIVYDFKQKIIIKQELAPDAKVLKAKDYKADKLGFIDLMNNEQYQKLFLPQGEDNNITLLEISQTIGNVAMTMTQNGIQVDTGHFQQYIGVPDDNEITLMEEPVVIYEGLN